MEHIQETTPMNVFELCRDLNKYGFPQKRHDEAYYYTRPDMLVRMDNMDALRTDDKKITFYISELVYHPELQDFFDFLGTDFQQLTRTNASGWFAYTNSMLGEGITTRSGGVTPWLALANVCLARFLEANQKFPPVDVSESEVKVMDAETTKQEVQENLDKTK